MLDTFWLSVHVALWTERHVQYVNHPFKPPLKVLARLNRPYVYPLLDKLIWTLMVVLPGKTDYRIPPGGKPFYLKPSIPLSVSVLCTSVVLSSCFNKSALIGALAFFYLPWIALYHAMATLYISMAQGERRDG
jgi:hypothetical protein